MNIPINVLSAKLEAEKINNWQGKLLLWESELKRLSDDPDITHVKWDTPNKSDCGFYSARKILATPGERRFSRKFKRVFFFYEIKDIKV